MATVQPQIYISTTDLVSCQHFAKKIRLFAKTPAKSQMLGETKSRFRGRGMEFDEVRQYYYGDDIRNIDWRITAKTQKAHTRLNTEDRERPILLLIDQRNNMFFGSKQQFKSVVATKIACYIAWAGLRESDRISALILTNSGIVKCGGKRMRKSVLEIIHSLAKLNNNLPETDSNIKVTFNDLLQYSRKISKPGTAVYLISDFLDIDKYSKQNFTFLAKNSALYFIQILDPIEKQLAILNNQSLAIANENTIKKIDFNTKIISKYQAIMAATASLLKRYSYISKGKFIEIDTTQDCFKVLYKYFH